MSAYGLHPTFTDATGYRAWRRTWRSIHTDLIARIAAHEARLASAVDDGEITRARETLEDMRVMEAKTNALLESAKHRAERIKAMHAQIAGQGFPIEIPDCPSIDFHFNKGAIEFPFLPAWIVRTKGRTYYVQNVEFDAIGTTRETPEHASTKGSMRFRRSVLTIDRDGNATIRRRTATQDVNAAIAA